MIDRLRQMAIFAKTIDHGSFRGAARELKLSPSVVSHHVSQLEEHLGVALLYRSTRKLTLTREGERLLAATQKMLEAVEGELHALTASANEPSGELRITAPSVLSNSPFTQMIARFMADYPRIRISLDYSDTRKELIGDGFDVAIRMAIRKGVSANTRRLFQVRRRLVAAPEFLARSPEVTEPAALRDRRWLELSPVQNTPVKLRKSGESQVLHRRSAHLACNDAQALYCLAREGAGLAVVPEFLTTEDVANGRIQYVLPDWQLDPIDVFAEWPSNAPKHGLIKLLVGALSETHMGS